MVEIQNEIANAERTNSQARMYQAYLAKLKEVEELESQYNAASLQLEEIKTTKDKALASAQMPISGLSIAEDGVLFNGIPLSQLSSAEQIKVSLAIAMAMTPKIRVIRITDGSLLDGDNMKVIQDMAKEKDYQIWLEKVDDSGKVGIVIEDGEVVAVNW